MNQARVLFYGGPFDGHSWQRPIAELLGERFGIMLDHAPDQIALYRLRAREVLSVPTDFYDYERTITVPRD
jgi:hypothetical protein